MCIAMSRACSPWLSTTHASRLPPDRITCSTGASPASTSGSGLSIAPAAKAVVFSTSATSCVSQSCVMTSRLTASFSDVTAIGSGLSPSRTSASASASNTAVFAACQCAR
ncbi:hypothetical protein BamIOP4010DRAFT_6590 [Burkholderia ambifaria IOP40-10]|uniref:Uncharacterized protein n=1 Tax=Burkholderia ambifaria IOP40-10 TaxID=396596 RepID=B1FRC9_9BURK|nr:hypothetical protein BamIOP4010DRAFT_6590 [Burkholderia ambifaria IOP40-10]